MKGNALIIYKDDKEADKDVLVTVHGEDVTAVHNVTTTRKSKGSTNWMYIEIATKHGVECLAAEDEKEGQQCARSLACSSPPLSTARADGSTCSSGSSRPRRLKYALFLLLPAW